MPGNLLARLRELNEFTYRLERSEARGVGEHALPDAEAAEAAMLVRVARRRIDRLAEAIENRAEVVASDAVQS